MKNDNDKINPRRPNPFFVTRPAKGGCCNPLDFCYKMPYTLVFATNV